MQQVEILMAVYNGEKYMKEQIQSILNQTHQNIRLIIRDNCSTDRTREILQKYVEEYPEKIKLLVSKENVGVIGNFSALLDHAEGNYIMFSDHDDIWLPEKIEKTLKKMLEIDGRELSLTPVLVHTDLTVVNERLETIHPSFWKYSNLNPLAGQTLSRLLLQNQVTGCTMMINKSLRDLARPIPKDIVMHDWWLALCAASFGKIAIVDEATMLYRQHGKNDTGAQRYSLISVIKAKFNKERRAKMQKCRQMTVVQAKQFLSKNSDRLSLESQEIIKAFIKFDDAIFFKKAILMFKYSFYRVGLFRNLCLIFGLRNLRILYQKISGVIK